jgi:hypothetical protein
MPGRMVSEDDRIGGGLKTSNEPSGPLKAGDKGSIGDQAFKDAVLIVAICWVIVFATIFSLRRHSV